MRVTFPRRVDNARWYELSEAIGKMETDATTRLIVSRQPRTIEEHEVRQAYQKLKDEQDKLTEFEEVITEGTLLGVFDQRGNAMAAIAHKEGVDTVSVFVVKPKSLL